jgi:hypothetical protein
MHGAGGVAGIAAGPACVMGGGNGRRRCHQDRSGEERIERKHETGRQGLFGKKIIHSGREGTPLYTSP